MRKIFKELEAVSGRLDKEAIIKKAALNGDADSFMWFGRALNPYVTYGIKKVPFAKRNGIGGNEKEFKDLLNMLAVRKLTGNDALDAIEDFMSTCTIDEWDNHYRRVLVKDPSCGVTIKTINKMLKEAKKKEWMIPVFECQLAKDSKGGEIGMNGVKQVEVKLDGVRVVTYVYEDGTVEMYSRSGRLLKNFPHIVEEIKRKVGKVNQAFVLDAEIMSGKFQDLMTQVNRKSNVNASDAILNVFDIMPLQEFQAGYSPMPQRFRTDMVHWFINKNEFEYLTCLGYDIVDLDTEEGQKKLEEINKRAIEGGYEGLMLKDVDAGYVCKRTDAWLKMKPWIEVTLTVIELEEGDKKLTGSLGALVCEGYEDGKHIVVKVGSGLTDEQRQDIWDADEIGMLVEIRADAITQAKNSDTYSLRFPRFKCFRGFKKGEKL